MTRREAAAALNVSERTVGTYAQSGRLEVRYVPGKTSPVADFDPDQVEALRKELTTQAKPQKQEVEVSASNLEVGDAKLEDDRALALPTSNFNVPTSKFGSGSIVAIEAAHLPTLAHALVDALKTSHLAAPSELASKIGITVPEACTLTGLSEKALRTAIKNGELPSKRMGRSIRLRPIDVRDWFDRQFAKDPADAPA